MKTYKNLYLIGTSHIAKQSVEEVEKVILEIKPKIVALELDKRRFFALMHPTKRKISLADIRKVGVKGFVFQLIGFWAEKKLGKIVGVPPGSEMKKAAEIAGKVKANLALIDEDIEIVLKRFSKRVTWREKGRFIKEILFSFVSSKQKIKIDLTKVPEERVIRQLTAQVRKRYPSFYKTIVEERNEYMAKNLYKLMSMEKEEPIVAVVGAGHEKELIDLIKHENKLHEKRDN
ncbi:TraB family protein [Candidatus Woesearchaeota archaeon]|nr:TraB family protein [Candidatus Woesearchaeota archaeon]